MPTPFLFPPVTDITISLAHFFRRRQELHSSLARPCAVAVSLFDDVDFSAAAEADDRDDDVRVLGVTQKVKIEREETVFRSEIA